MTLVKRHRGLWAARDRLAILHTGAHHRREVLGVGDRKLNDDETELLGAVTTFESSFEDWRQQRDEQPAD